MSPKFFLTALYTCFSQLRVYFSHQLHGYWTRDVDPKTQPVFISAIFGAGTNFIAILFVYFACMLAVYLKKTWMYYRVPDHFQNLNNSSVVQWLRAPQRIKFKLAVIVYRALHGTAPRYITVRHVESRCWHFVSESSPLVDLQSIHGPPVTSCHCRGAVVRTV